MCSQKFSFNKCDIPSLYIADTPAPIIDTNSSSTSFGIASEIVWGLDNG